MKVNGINISIIFEPENFLDTVKFQSYAASESEIQDTGLQSWM